MADKTFSVVAMQSIVQPGAGTRDNNLRTFIAENGTLNPDGSAVLDDGLFLAAGHACGPRQPAVTTILTETGV